MRPTSLRTPYGDQFNPHERPQVTAINGPLPSLTGGIYLASSLVAVVKCSANGHEDSIGEVLPQGSHLDKTG
jgi:hypothetical protein